MVGSGWVGVGEKVGWGDALGSTTTISVAASTAVSAMARGSGFPEPGSKRSEV